MLKKALVGLLVSLLTFCLFTTALCEEEWPDDLLIESDDEGEFDFEDDMPFESDVAAWYDAMDVYAMFINCAVDIDYNTPNSDGTRYLVTDERFTSLEDLLNYAQHFFSDEIARELVYGDMYKEEDGLLYALDTVFYADENIGDIEVVSAAEGDDLIRYEVTISYLSPNRQGNDSETFLYTRAFFGDSWRFTEFPYI